MAAILALQVLLLDKFVRNQKTAAIEAERDAETVFGIEVALEAGLESGESGAIGEILEHRRIEKAVGTSHVDRKAEDVAAVEITVAQVKVFGVETSSTENGSAVQAARGIAVGRGFDHASKLAAELGGNAGGVSLDRLYIVEIIGWREGGGAIVEDGETVDDILGIVFGAAGMKDPVGFEHPAGLRLNEIGALASGNGSGPIAQRGRSKLIGVAGVCGIEKRVGISYVNGLRDGSDGEYDRYLPRQLGADLDQRVVRSESGVFEGQMVSAEWQLLGSVFAGRRGVESELEVACLADQKSVGG
jgi:hypothetical protein